MASKFAPSTLSAALTAGLAMCLHVAPVAAADPVQMAPQVYSKVSSDGWRLNIQIRDETINSVPNLASASNSREAFVTATATASAVGGANPIQDSIFILGYQLGCQSDVSSGLNIGGTGGVSGSIGLPSTLGASAGVAGFVQTIVQPGVIVDLPMTNMALSSAGTANLSIDNLHIKADACGGDVTVRSYAYLRTSTEFSHTSFEIYGDPIKI